jgi:hypothetical protein
VSPWQIVFSLEMYAQIASALPAVPPSRHRSHWQPS